MKRNSTPRISIVAALALLFAAAGTANSWQKEVVETRTFQVSGQGQLDVNVYDADLVITTGNGSQSVVEVTLGAKDLVWARKVYDSMSFTFEGGGSSLDIRSSKAKVRDTWRHGGMSVSIALSLPEGWGAIVRTGDGDIAVSRLNGPIELSTGDGDITLRAADSNLVNLKTSDGDIVLGEIRAPQVALRTSDGDISVKRLVGREHRIQTSDGDIVIDDLVGDLYARSSDGDVRVTMSEGGELDLRSGDGDISIRLPRGLGADLELAGSDVALDAGSAFNGVTRDERVSGQLAGGGPRISARTGDGDVVVRARD